MLRLPLLRICCVFMVLPLWTACGQDTAAAAPDDVPTATDAVDATDAATDAGQTDAAVVTPDTASDAADGVDAAADVSVVVCTCGDGTCNGFCGETVETCSIDCAICGDGKCTPGESPDKCPVDCCGACGDGKCTGYQCGESPQKCPQDCGTTCGNGTCDKGENPLACPADCQHQVCGNGICEPEDGGPIGCPQDCGQQCGNCVCDKSESWLNCPVDCGFCGDGVCSLCGALGESAASCPADCKGTCAGGCDDGVDCTNDVCGSDGNCAHLPDAATCSDGNACTDDGCNLKTGCVHTLSNGSCTDGNPCTVGDGCQQGTCFGTAKDCDDGSSCSTDACDATTGGCTHTPIDGACDDNNACTLGDVCGGGVCLPGAPTACDDSNACTSDVCVPKTGCAHANNNFACNDGNLCTIGDACQAGACVSGNPAPCSDGNACTTDVCNSLSGGCDHTQNSDPCNDNNACTKDDACLGGACVGGSVLNCNDGDGCTADSCDPGIGCVNTPIACPTCTPGLACAPDGNPCHVGLTDCATKAPVCIDQASNLADDAPCGPAKGCQAGVCQPYGVTIGVLSGGNQQTAMDSVLAPFVIQALDANQQPVGNLAVTVTPPPGAVATPSSGKTGASTGKFTFVARQPRDLGDHVWTVRVKGAAPLDVVANAAEPATATVATLLNAEAVTGDDGKPGPATLAHVGQVADLAVAKDGAFYVADGYNHRIIRVDPQGVATVLAGTGATSYLGDGGPAAQANLNRPEGLALDEAHQLLYVADTGHDVVRVIDLTAQTIDLFAGGATTLGPNYGDGNPALAVGFSAPGHLSLGPDGALYVADTGHSRIRRVDVNSTIVTAWFGGSCSSGEPFALYGCGDESDGYFVSACTTAWDSWGNAYISGYFCGSGLPNSSPGLVRRAPDGTVTWVAGKSGGAVGDGGPAAGAIINYISGLAIDSIGNVYLSEWANHRVRRIDAATTRISTVLGTGVAGSDPDGAAANKTALQAPWALAFHGNDLLFVDEGAKTVREVAQFNPKQFKPAQLQVVDGANQSVSVGQAAGAPLTVAALDGDGTPLVGFPVQFSGLDDGVGLYSNGADTGSGGIASTSVRVGLRPGPYRVRTRLLDLYGNDALGSPLDVTLTALALNPGDIFTALNTGHSSGDVGKPGAATLAQTGAIAGLDVTADGTIYAVDAPFALIYRITPGGAVSIVAGAASGGIQSDNIPATSALLNTPYDVAFDPFKNRLLIDDVGANRIRAVDLTTGFITTFAGGGSQPSPGYGDGGAASNAQFSQPAHVTVGPDSNIYVSDSGFGRVRVIDSKTGIISAWIGEGGSGAACGTATAELYYCGGSYTNGYAAGCPVTFDPAGNAWIAGSICGTAIGGTTTGILKRSVDGTVTWFAGGYNTTEDGTAKKAKFAYITDITRDSQGGIWVVEGLDQRVRRIATDGSITLMAGVGKAGFLGDYGAAIGAELNGPWGIALLPTGQAVIGEWSNYDLRIVW